MRLARQIVSKLLRFVGAVIAVSFLTFLLSHQIPGDPTVIILQSAAGNMQPCGQPFLSHSHLDCAAYPANVVHERGAISPGGRTSVCKASKCIIAADVLRHDLYLDRPLLSQYWHWARNAIHGQLGMSYDATPVPVWPSIKAALPPTLTLMLMAEVIAIVLAVPLGIYSAYRENRLGDRVTTGASFLFLALPNFVLAVFLIVIFVTTFHLFPSAYSAPAQGLWQSINTMIIPAIALAMGATAVYLRLLRSDMIATLQEDFILMARAKGLPPRRILVKHALRPSSFSLLTVFGINVGALIGGTVIMEVMFSIPGIGTLLTTSIYKRNYPVLQACVVVIAAGYVAVNVLVDIMYTVLDPRIRHA